ncbi:hypothetical protein J7E96_11215 [Streptomyces sp. ISL-96]|uniref:hypothetical protein n=1 Tax=Streptomyces sp. ISL-96 TaxID=2819191 RepID=UPI001BED2978|nr:hypothetical protein [Streptomyces sp. ISL-96]MBT2489082.1 hypothetical protein [Streptomyces sp. ISL-96]
MQKSPLSIVAIVFGAVALFICPPLFGILGLVFGGIAKYKDEPLAVTGLIVAGAGLAIGMVLGFVVFSSMSTP